MNYKRFAYLIGANGPQEMRLSHAEKDVIRLADALNGNHCRFNSVKVAIAHNRDSALKSFKELADKCDSSSLLLVHFSGHAIFDEQLYLICNDTLLDDIYSTALDINTVKTILRKSKARHKLLILDCCQAAGAHLGALKGEQDTREVISATAQGSSAVILSACSKRDRTRELDELDNGSGFLSWAIRAACTSHFQDASSHPDLNTLSLDDLWKRWMPKALDYVNQTLSKNDPIPNPILLSESESGYGNEIWLTNPPNENKNTYTKKTETQEKIFITQSDYFEQKAAYQGIHLRHFDHIPCPGASLADLKIGKIGEFLGIDLVRRQEDFQSEVSLQTQLVKFGLMHEATPTYAAVLCFGYIPQSFIPGATTRCVIWRGNTRDNGYDDDKECRGDLLEQLVSCLDFLRKCLRLGRNISNDGKTDKYEIPFIALQEAVANALIHREYASFIGNGEYAPHTDCVQVEVFDNRVEIKSPGPPPLPLNALLAEDISRPINSLIARIFYLYGHVERVGSGIQRMQNAMRNVPLSPPQFKLSDSNTFKVILDRPRQLIPDASILSVLGEIEFKPWQCIAELVDNSVDGFLRMDRAGAPIDTPTVQVAFGRDTVTVKDNGPGMSLDALENAVKAGWNSNGRFGYGVGFNIATARLGTLTTIWTTQAGDDTWNGLEIDLQKLAVGKSYNLNVKTRSKSDALLSGTEVEVKKIKPDWKDLIVDSSRLRSHITDRLSSIYGTMLRDINPQPIKFSLYVNNKKVPAWEHCTWPTDWEKYRKEEGLVRPVQEIDITFGEKYVSQSTGEMYSTKEGYMREGVDASDIVVMPERVYGWIGIQRYADEKEYGIDILRNGRKIEVLCKDLFDWEQPDGETRHEYPIDDPRQRGRIVGELHLDHGYVHYTKHRFEREHSSWKQLLKAVRHDEPFTLRESLGYPRVNASPLGVLFRTFRRNSPSFGQKWEDILFIKDNEKAKEWAKEYRKGNPQYQDDQRWLEELRKSDEV